MPAFRWFTERGEPADDNYRRELLAEFEALLSESIKRAVESAGTDERIVIVNIFFATGGGAKVVLGDDNYQHHNH